MKPAFGLTMPKDLPYDTLMHVAFAVPDIERAMVELGESFGVTWTAVRSVTMRVRVGDGSELVAPMKAVYSREGPAYWELVWGPPGTRFSAHEGARYHHAGMFIDDVDAEVARLQARGWTLTGRILDAEGVPGTAFLTGQFGINLELLTTPARTTVQNWIFPPEAPLGS